MTSLGNHIYSLFIGIILITYLTDEHDLHQVDEENKFDKGLDQYSDTPKGEPDAFKTQFNNLSAGSGIRYENESIRKKVYEKDKSSMKTDSQIDPDLFILSANSYEASEHGNDFICFPCNCSHIDRGMSVANCTFKNLFRLPLTLPRNVLHINMTGNHVKHLNVSDVCVYSHLKTLDFTDNNLMAIRIANQSEKLTSRLINLTLENNKISVIEIGSLEIFRNLRELRLSHNRLKIINSTTFKNLEKLNVLDLSWNGIKSISENSFDSLVKLRSLFLNNNRFGYKILRNPRLVRNLTLLQKLHIQGNANNEPRYPNECLGQLKNLQELFIDAIGHGAEFGTELRQLIHLKTLSFGPEPRCTIRNISATFFQNVPFIENLTFDFCRFRDFDYRAFYYLPNLKSYNLIYINTYDLEQAFNDLRGIHNKSTITSLKFVHLYHTAPLCRALTHEQGQYINTLVNLERLDLSSNRLALLGDDFLWCIPGNLKQLFLSGNRLGLEGNMWSRITFLQHLERLDLAYQNVYKGHIPLIDNSCSFRSAPYLQTSPKVQTSILYHGRQKYSARTRSCAGYKLGNNSCISRCHQRKMLGGRHVLKTSSQPNMADILNMPEMKTDNFDFVQDISPVSRKEIRPPPNLVEVNARDYKSYGNVLLFKHVMEPYKLWNLNFASSYMLDWGNGRLPSKTRILDLSNNNCGTMSHYFFPARNQLIHLNIRNNYLGEAFREDTGGKLFRHLDKLNYLDVSFNSIVQLPANFFKGLHGLRKLIMSDNKLQVFNINISKLAYLNYVDVNRNSISWIEKSLRQDLDLLASFHLVRLDLTYNPLPCTCKGIEILEWMANTKVILLGKPDLQCSDDQGKVPHNIGDIKAKVNLLKRQCTSYMTLIIGCSAGFGGCLLSVALWVVLYKQRWRIMYSFNVLLLSKVFGFRPRGRKSHEMKYDAYIVYDEDDRDFVIGDITLELETKRGHKLCFEDRDFIPGTPTFNNIVNAVQNSIVTMFIISPDFIKAREFEYALQMALVEEYYGQNKREVCKLLLYKSTPNKDMNKDFQMLLMNNRYIEYPQENNGVTQDMYDNFWNRLSNEIGRAENHVETEAESQSLIGSD